MTDQGRLQSSVPNSLAAHVGTSSNRRDTNKIDTVMSQELLELHTGGSGWFIAAHLGEISRREQRLQFHWPPQYTGRSTLIMRIQSSDACAAVT